MKDINVICVYNSKGLYDNMVQSFEDNVPDDLSYAFIPLDKRENRFSSVAQAFNIAIDNHCDAKCLIFTHQDIVFYNDVEKIYKYCINDSNTIFGAAGVKAKKHLYDRNDIISAISQNERSFKPYHINGDAEDVFVLDECLFACNEAVFSKIKFDSETCNSWHLYAADLCMQAKLKGIGVKVLALDVLHISEGFADGSFYKCLSRLARKYKGKYKIVQGSCGFNSTNPLLRKIVDLYIIYRRVSRFIKRKTKNL